MSDRELECVRPARDEFEARRDLEIVRAIAREEVLAQSLEDEPGLGVALVEPWPRRTER